MARQGKNVTEGYAAVFVTVLIWSTPSLFQFYLNRFYDPFAQNFYRYSVGCLAILPFAIYRFRKSGPRLDLGVIGACLVPAVPNVIHQVTQTLSLYYMGPGVYAIFTRSSVIITALLALLFFPDERWIVRQWRFQVGTLLGLLGAVGVFWFEPGWTTGHVPLGGLAIAFTATFCWALYGVLVKGPSARLGSIRSFGVISFLTSALLGPLTFFFGKIGTPLHVSAHVNGIVIISAVSCISLAHVLYYVAIREIGVALSQTLQLLSPVGAVALSAWLFHERLSPMQIVSALILLLGAFLAMRVKPAVVVEVAENV
ncbi:MAG TPA: DMT family transporter [Chthoniobacterales bacterium]|jgi:drug/metabolite transporter (DMT)-like permease|nr:DMT family transporter [Chthoniobacterales bacterium]